MHVWVRDEHVLISRTILMLVIRHMLAGLSRFSKRCANSLCSKHHVPTSSKYRSIAATATFFCTAVAATKLHHSPTLIPANPPDYNMNTTDKTLLIAQTVPLIASVLLYAYVRLRLHAADLYAHICTGVNVITQPRHVFKFGTA